MKSPFTFRTTPDSRAHGSRGFSRPSPPSSMTWRSFTLAQGLSNDHGHSHTTSGTPVPSRWASWQQGGAWAHLRSPGSEEPEPFRVSRWMPRIKRAGPYAGPPNWQNEFLPAAYQERYFRSEGRSDSGSLGSRPVAGAPGGSSGRADSTRWICSMANFPTRRWNDGGNVGAFGGGFPPMSLPYRMQSCAPEAVDLLFGERRSQAVVRHQRSGLAPLMAVEAPAGSPPSRARRALRSVDEPAPTSASKIPGMPTRTSCPITANTLKKWTSR